MPIVAITPETANDVRRACAHLKWEHERHIEDLKKWIAKGPPEVGPAAIPLMQDKIKEHEGEIENLKKLITSLDGSMDRSAVETYAAVPKNWLRSTQATLRGLENVFFGRNQAKGHRPGTIPQDQEVVDNLNHIRRIQNIDEAIGDFLEL